MLGPSPGPAPTPSLTLPPLRELDKILSPDSDHNRIPIHHSTTSGQPRSQSSDPHLHQHFHQQRQQHGQSTTSQQQQQQQQQHQSYGQQQQQQSGTYSKHDQGSRYSSASGSLPDLYMSSPSAPPSTTTSSSLSRVDSISTMEYLQSNTHEHGQRHQSNGTTASSTSPSDQQGPNSAGANTGAKESKSSGTTSGSEQGRNSSKRAAQNRAAQRAFRQRKDLYVRELERKAELLQVAESQLISLAARNRELEALFAAQHQASSSSPLPSPLPQSDCHATGMVGTGNLSRGERDWDRERDWARERTFEGAYDHFHSSRPAIGRHSSAQHLRQAYNSNSPPLSSGSIKHLSLGSKLPAAYHHQRPESDQEIEMQGRPQRHLHRHPSESCLNLNRTAAFATLTGEGKDEDFPGVSSRSAHNYRSPVDSRIEMESPTSSSKSPMSGSSGPFHDSPAHHYPSSPLSPTHERMPLYSSRENPRPSGGGAGGVSSGTTSSPNGMHGDVSSSANYDLNKKRPSEGAVNWTGSDLYRSPQDSHPHPYHQSVKKQSSWSSLSDQRRLHAVKKQPSWGSISEHRHHWRTKTDSPEMPSDAARFGGVAPALPRIPPQFSQRPPPPQRSSFEREVSPTAAAAAAAAAAPFSYSPPSSSWQSSSDYYSHSRGGMPPPHEGSHGPSDMDIEGSSGYSRQGDYEAGPYEVKREERSDRLEQHMGNAHAGSP
ncbi:hypothetical protein BGX26_004810 [Mortierella sp. AD094]|nr:hypothetical protein BGX26_004810 [Mortierella sp. AD094]